MTRSPRRRTAKAPTLAEVNAAWAVARKERHESPDVAGELRTDPLRARPFYQGVVEEYLLQQRARARGSKLYLVPSPSQRRAVGLTRRWLEFGEWP